MISIQTAISPFERNFEAKKTYIPVFKAKTCKGNLKFSVQQPRAATTWRDDDDDDADADADDDDDDDDDDDEDEPVCFTLKLNVKEACLGQKTLHARRFAT